MDKPNAVHEWNRITTTGLTQIRMADTPPASAQSRDLTMSATEESGIHRSASTVDLIRACTELNESVKKLINDEKSSLSSRITLLERQNNDLSISLTSSLTDSGTKVRLATARAEELEKTKIWLSAAESAALERIKSLESELAHVKRSCLLFEQQISSHKKELEEIKTEKEELSSYADEVECDINKLQKTLKEEQTKNEDLNSCLLQMQRHYDVLHHGLQEQRMQKAEEKSKSTQKDFDFGAVLFALFSHMGKVYRPENLREILDQFFTKSEVEAVMSRESAYGQWVRGALNRSETLDPQKPVAVGQKRPNQDDTSSFDKDPNVSSRTKRLSRVPNVSATAESMAKSGSQVPQFKMPEAHRQ